MRPHPQPSFGDAPSNDFTEADASLRSPAHSGIHESGARALSPEGSTASTLRRDAAARRLIAALVERGVDTFFGIPGGPVCPVFEALRGEPRARLVESRHETHAAFAAALYHRVSGRVPAVVVTAGPGVTNVVTGVASASLERVPMLIIVGDVAWETAGGRMTQDSGPEGIDAEAILRPVTRAQIRARSARTVVSQAMAALDAACAPGLPGPALFVLAMDRAMAASPAVELAVSSPVVVSPPNAESVARTAAWLAEAERPLVVIGAGSRGHEQSVRRLVDTLNVPFVTTPRAKGLVSERHPWSLRNGGMAASIWARRYTAEPVDVCLALGTDLDDVSVGPTPYLGKNGRLVHVDLDARVFNRNVPTALGVGADVGAFVRALSEHVTELGLVNPCARRALDDARSVPPHDVAFPQSDDASPIRPHRLMLDLERAVRGDARFVTDIGEHMLFALHYLTADPGSFFVQLNLGSMGSGIAGAVGLSLADGSRPIVCIAGDGGMQMAGMEALVAVREGLPILFVVANDGRYNMVHHGMRQIFGSAALYDTPPIDFAAWARSFGMPSAVVTRPGEITGDSIEKLLGGGGPALLDVRIDASVRVRTGGRVEALQQMSMLANLPAESP